jgi:four helix bundle protein
MPGFRQLRVWQAAMDLVEAIYLTTRSYPQHEIYGLTSQMRRAAVSVPSNIAEGHVREHLREYLHHVSIAQGSLAEVETQIEISARLGYLGPGARDALLEQTASVGRQLYGLRNSLARSTTTPDTRHPTPDTP